MKDHEGSTCLRHEPCDACGSKDNKGVFSDGHTYCFGCGAYVRGDGSSTPNPTREARNLNLIKGDVQGLRARKITDETAKVFNYQTGEYNGEPCQIANYYDASGELIAQKLRLDGKQFKWLGDSKQALPFGAHAWPRTGRKIVVTEGEIDALAMSQVQGNSWPVVSIGCGAGAQIGSYFAKHADYFNGFDEVVIMFDNDPPGRAAAQSACEVLGRRAKVATLPQEFKDASDMLKAGKVKELLSAMWQAAPYRPEGIIELSSLKDAAKERPQVGLSYPWESLTRILHGIRLHQLIGLGAGVGSGKSELYTQMMAHLMKEHRKDVAAFFLESQVAELGRRVVGKIAGKAFHDPEAGWTDTDIDEAFDGLKAHGRLFLYDSFGNNEWEPIKAKIEYLYHAEGVQYFFVDHLTALAAWQEDEKKALEIIMSEAGALVKKLPITIFYVSHLATPEGKSHEEGGRVTGRHFKGSRAIIQWSTDLLGMERDQQAEDETARGTTTIRCLKERTTGKGTGQVFYLRYDYATGLLYESEAPPDGSTPQFRDETNGAPSDGRPSDF